ncbi:alpha/beta fold hydrolase [Dankookia sp. GCM10030260]|uniref:alpha/beta fold hydrolase n=1 Tax=Dankookia sp. GCM10030260 TaxID=3273390 RepID=UPI003609DE5B
MTPILLLHGIGGASWAPVLPALAPAPVIDWPLPGFAGTPMPAETSFAAWADLLRLHLDAEGLSRVDLVGHSIGGMLALDFALRFPGRVRGLVLYATTPAFGGRDPAFAKAFLAERLAPLETGQNMPALAESSIRPMLRPGTPAALVDLAVAAMASAPEAAYRAAVRCLTTFNRRDDLGRLAAPTLLVAGEADALAPPRTMERMRDAIPGARLAVLPGCGHLAHLEDTTGFNAAVAGFLRGLPEG